MLVVAARGWPQSFSTTHVNRHSCVTSGRQNLAATRSQSSRSFVSEKDQQNGVQLHGIGRLSGVGVLMFNFLLLRTAGTQIVRSAVSLAVHVLRSQQLQNEAKTKCPPPTWAGCGPLAAPHVSTPTVPASVFMKSVPSKSSCSVFCMILRQRVSGG